MCSSDLSCIVEKRGITKRELSQLYYLSREIKRDKRRLKELEALAEGTTQHLTGMPIAPGFGDKTARYAIEIMELKEIIECNMRRCMIEYNRLIRFISSVEDSQMRQILTLRYVNGMTWQRIATEIGETDESYPRRKHNKFLKLAENAEFKNL